MPRLLVCGTREVKQCGPSDFRVVCSSCGGGGSVRHPDRNAAGSAAVRDSNKPCPARPGCGAH